MAREGRRQAKGFLRLLRFDLVIHPVKYFDPVDSRGRARRKEDGIPVTYARNTRNHVSMVEQFFLGHLSQSMA